MSVEQKELIAKLEQIEEQAKDTLAEFPTLTKERLRMIIALARYLRTEGITRRRAECAISHKSSGFRRAQSRAPVHRRLAVMTGRHPVTDTRDIHAPPSGLECVEFRVLEANE